MREFIRHPSDIPIEVVTEGAPQRRWHISNVSVGGLAFLSESEVALGSMVEVRIPSVDPPFETHGQVVWCKPCEVGYEVGIQFLEAEDAFRTRMVEQVCHIEDYKKGVAESEGRSLTGEEAACEWIQKYAATFPSPGFAGP